MFKLSENFKDPIDQIKFYLKIPSLLIVSKNIVSKLNTDTLLITNSNGIPLEVENAFFKEYGNFENISVLFDVENEYFSEDITGFINVDDYFRISLIIVAADYKNINLNILLSKDQEIKLEQSIIRSYYEMLIECYGSLKIKVVHS